MDIIERLRTHYENNPPLLSYGGSEGENMRSKIYSEWPKEEESRFLGIAVVWRGQITGAPDTLSPCSYCVIDVCLDVTGHKNPRTLPLPPEMQGHTLLAVVYTDMLDCIHMRAIGGFTSLSHSQRQTPK